jgi:hypothetical protein
MVTHESRSALERAQFFLDKAIACNADERVDFEAYLEATIVFARSAVHRFKKRFGSHPEFRSWWDSVLADSAVTFTRVQRDWILKDASLKIGQKGYAASVGCQAPSWQPTKAGDFYYFEGPSTPATVTVMRHLAALKVMLGEAEQRFLV